MIRWTLQTETSKACLLSTLMCGQSWWGEEGGEERYLLVFLCLRFLDLYAVGIDFISHVPMSKTKKECIVFEPLVSRFTYSMTCVI